jgi:hypothetical protein
VLSEKTQKNGLLFSELTASYELTKAALTGMKDSNLQHADRCPSVIMLLDEVQSGKATEYLHDLEGLTPDVAAAKFGIALFEFVNDVANPFLHQLLTRLKVAFEQSSQVQLLAALDRVVLPSNLEMISREWRCHEQKQAKSKKQQTFSLAPQSSAERRAFAASLSTVVEGLELSQKQTAAFKLEQESWRMLCGARQLARIQKGLSPIRTITDLVEELKDKSQPEPSARSPQDPSAKSQRNPWEAPPVSIVFDSTVSRMCPHHCLVLCIVQSSALATANVERGFSKFARTQTRTRNRLTSPQLNHLMLVSAHAPQFDDPDLETFFDLALVR